MSDDSAFAPTVSVEDDHDDTRLTLFEGDDGELTLDQRRCLIVILKHPVVADERAEWATLVRDSRVIKSRLNDLFLDLVIDRERGIAYKVQIRSGEFGFVRPAPARRCVHAPRRRSCSSCCASDTSRRAAAACPART